MHIQLHSCAFIQIQSHPHTLFSDTNHAGCTCLLHTNVHMYTIWKSQHCNTQHISYHIMLHTLISPPNFGQHSFHMQKFSFFLFCRVSSIATSQTPLIIDDELILITEKKKNDHLSSTNNFFFFYWMHCFLLAIYGCTTKVGCPNRLKSAYYITGILNECAMKHPRRLCTTCYAITLKKNRGSSLVKFYMCPGIMLNFYHVSIYFCFYFLCLPIYSLHFKRHVY